MSPAGGTLLPREGGYRVFPEAIDPVPRSGPNAALPILEHPSDGVCRQTVCSVEPLDVSARFAQEPAVERSDPQVPVAIDQNPRRPQCAFPRHAQQRIAIATRKPQNPGTGD